MKNSGSSEQDLIKVKDNIVDIYLYRGPVPFKKLKEFVEKEYIVRVWVDSKGVFYIRKLRNRNAYALGGCEVHWIYDEGFWRNEDLHREYAIL